MAAFTLGGSPRDGEANLDTVGVRQLKNMKGLFSAVKWYELVPYQNHTVVTGGYNAVACVAGNLATRIGKNHELVLRRLRHYAFIASNDCGMAARTSDGSLVLAYMPTSRTITVDMSNLLGPVTARWYDPTSGEFDAISGSRWQTLGAGDLRR